MYDCRRVVVPMSHEELQQAVSCSCIDIHQPAKSKARAVIRRRGRLWVVTGACYQPRPARDEYHMHEVVLLGPHELGRATTWQEKSIHGYEARELYNDIRVNHRGVAYIFTARREIWIPTR